MSVGSSIRGANWSAVAVGWVVALVVGFVLALVFGLIGLAASEEATRGEIGAGSFLLSLVIGFLSYLVGGYVAGRRAGVAGPLHGMLTAVFGLIIAVVLAVVLLVIALLFLEGEIPRAPGVLGVAGGGFLTGLTSFLVNLAGGYLGGRLSRTPPSGPRRPSRVR
ncbi:hypothetical protein Rxycam_01833 [Rubrobacter xylanophilus DSM 9941]|uniref:hypothetical protein n=1 Tax=Rubrobacter xylanophilus TaxID=49319 RepID=UPI001C63FF2F|nr:hypothetical protein [Rubrobacter xylanophilus]QYJ16003.1 hypothetical protein Rxycam_01833 [Rubrobacter xylanophilus DSM 9941]